MPSLKSDNNNIYVVPFRIYITLVFFICPVLFCGLKLIAPDTFSFMQKPNLVPARFVFLYAFFTVALIGMLLGMLRFNLISRNNSLFWSCFFMIGILYAITLVERIQYGDVSDYIRAAINIVNHEPFHARYIYPPLWATILQPFANFGYHRTELFCVTANFISFLLLFTLTYKMLLKFKFPKNTAVIAITIFFLINTPVLRTFHYVQVNFHVINTILICFLAYPNHKFISALSLAIGTHLKVSPIIFCLLFLLNKDFIWLVYFFVSCLIIVLLTSLANDVSYYMCFVDNLSQKTSSMNYVFRQNSIDSFVRATSAALSINPAVSSITIITAKISILLTSMIILYRSINSRSVYNTESRDIIPMNGFIITSMLMVLISPVIWAHHLVFCIPAFLILAIKITTKSQAVLYFSTLILIFILPVTNMFPFSYHRLLGILIAYILVWQTSKTPVKENSLLLKFEDRLNNTLCLS